MQSEAPRSRGSVRTDEATRSRRAKRARGALGPDVARASRLQKREERDRLAHDVDELDEQLETLRRLAGLPTRDETAEIEDVRARNAELDEALHVNELYLGRLQSLVTSEQLVPTVNPMATFIHLPRDMAERRAILRGLQDVKLRRGVDVAVATFAHLDPLLPYRSVERFTTESGEYHCLVSEINQFRNFTTAKQLFDVFVQFLYNMEISITEGLGQLTLREDTEAFDPTIWNHRFVTVAEDVGCTEELNLVGFAGFSSHSPVTDSPLGIVAFDTVNIDDLYPYLPAQRTCKDVQAAHLVYEARIPETGETVVVLKQRYVIVQLPPQFELEPGVLRQLQENSTRWCVFIVKYLREYVTADAA